MADNAQKLGHPAAFSKDILTVVAELIDGFYRVLDPFAGVGGIHSLGGHETVGVEIEHEWAAKHPNTICGNALDLPFPDESFDAIATSPTYGNRMADSHNARDGSHRSTYRHMLGRPLAVDNSGHMQWGNSYREFHRKAWGEALRVLKRDGMFVLNIKDHIRGGKWQDVAGWHIGTLQDFGLAVTACRPVVTEGRKFGANSDLRSPAELVIAFRK